jgi:hypothetical protein
MPWNINIEAPNGATAHFVFDEEKSKDPAKAMTEQFGELVSQMREHDPEPMTSKGRTQPRREPKA